MHETHKITNRHHWLFTNTLHKLNITKTLQIMAQSESILVFYPSPFIGHFVSMVELAKFIIKHHPSFSIIFLIPTIPPPQTTTITASYLHKVSSTTPSITFHHLKVPISPNIKSPPLNPFDDFFCNVSYINNPILNNTLPEIISSHPSSNIKAFIIDFLCNASFDVAQSLNLPTYYFWPTSASGLTLLLHLPYLDHETLTNKTFIQVPNMPTIPWCDAPPPLATNSSKKSYENFLSTSINMSTCKGIIMNTFEGLEPRALKVLSSGVCTPNVPKVVPIYYVGPLIGSDETGSEMVDDKNECLAWLSLQPSKSVVFLCFGSMGLFSIEQLREMAEGLERSGHRFLWVVKDPSKGDETSLDELLPKGFLNRVKNRGFVVKCWVPQKEVLSHDSVGGFVTHCGWNSVLEAVCGGVPMVGWPLYAEQRLNKVFMVEEMKVALPLDMLEDGLVKSSELERRVREMMDPNSVSGERVRKQVMKMRDGAMVAKGVTGSSRIDLDKLAMSWFGTSHMI